jgi:hypothetical protein
MTKRAWKKIGLVAGAVVLLAVITLGVHIYWVTRSHVNARNHYMARIDLHQPIDQADSARIKAWLLQQKGVDRVMVSPRWSTAVFTFTPLANVNGIIQDFKASLPYHNAVRYLPTTAQVKRGCPVMH